MCGIFGYIGSRKNSPELVLSGLKNLEYRGYDSWGVGYLDNQNLEKLQIRKKTGKIGNHSLADIKNSNFAIGHTRWATHGGVTAVNAHPHLDCSKQFALIHNGIIENYYSLKADLIGKKHQFISETDTEAAVHLIEENYRRLSRKSSPSWPKDYRELFLESVRLSFKQFEGLNAIIVMDLKTRTFVAAKNGSPLVMGKGKNENFLSSDAHALLPYTNQVFFMEDGQLVLVAQDKIRAVDLEKGAEISPKFIKLNWKENLVQKGNFTHFMIKEIYDQPKILNQILSEKNIHLQEIAQLIKKSYGTYLVGCGTAAYACLAGTYIFSKIAKRHINFSVGSEFGYLADFLTPKSLVFALSQSGETIDVIEAVKKAKEKKAKILSLVNVLGSTLYRMSDKKILLGAGVEKAVVTTKAFTAKLAYLYLLAYLLSGNYEKGLKNLYATIAEAKKILQKESIARIKKLVQLIKNKDHIYVIGRGISYPIALETALKIKESSYIHAEGFAAGELKHGVIALIEKGTPCIAFVPKDDSYSANLAGAMELKARGGFIIGISYKDHEEFDYYLPNTDLSIMSCIPSIIIGQLLGYYLALARGTDPDKPRNLAKSVTVK